MTAPELEEHIAHDVARCAGTLQARYVDILVAVLAVQEIITVDAKQTVQTMPGPEAHRDADIYCSRSPF